MALFLPKEHNEVLFVKNSGVGKVILNRPMKLNSINYEMVDQIIKRVLVYENDPAVKLVILKGNGRAFCAGGDLISTFNCVVNGHWSFGASSLAKQYTLDYILGTYKKPLAALLNGIVIGGGAGMSMNATFRIVTENTKLLYIGHFPDAGASFFLSRLPGFFGEYVGLTGTRLDATLLLECGLATHFVHSKVGSGSDVHRSQGNTQQSTTSMSAMRPSAFQSRGRNWISANQLIQGRNARQDANARNKVVDI